MAHLDNKLKWCLNKGKENGKKHRGLREVKPNPELAMRHITKAQHNLDAMLHNKGKFSDWSVSASFYSMYHCLLAILAKYGYESRNQECTLAAVEMLIDKKKIDLDKEWLRKIAQFDDALNGEDMLSLRERFQYGIQMMISADKLKDIEKDTKEFIETIREVLKK